LSFAPGDKHLLVMDGRVGLTEPRLEVWSLTDLEPTTYGGTIDRPQSNARLVPRQGGVGLGWLVWPEAGRTKISGCNKAPLTVSGLDLTVAGRALAIDEQEDGTIKALLLDPGDKIEIWNLGDGGQRLRTVAVPGGVFGAGFTIDGRGVYVKTEGGGL